MKNTEPQIVEVKLAERSYPVYVGKGLLDNHYPASSVPDASIVLIVSNETIAPLYLNKLKESLARAEIHTLVLPDGEQFKTLEYWSRILDKLVEVRATRDATVLTLGGGVI